MKGYFLYYEETDWCAKMKKYGYKLVLSPNQLSIIRFLVVQRI